MAKGSVRKKGKKWYYRFYVEDTSGNLVQKEFAGTESKSETEKLLRQAMEDYEAAVISGYLDTNHRDVKYDDDHHEDYQHLSTIPEADYDVLSA